MQGFSSIRLWSRQVEASGSIIALKSMVATQIQNENDISLFSGGNLTVVANHGTRRSSMIQMGNTVELKTFIQVLGSLHEFNEYTYLQISSLVLRSRPKGLKFRTREDEIFLPAPLGPRSFLRQIYKYRVSKMCKCRAHFS